MYTPNLMLPEVPQAIARSSGEINAGFLLIDALLHLAVASRGVATPPPPNAVQGQRWIIPDGATDAWANRVGHIAFRGPRDWLYFVPRPGYRARVLDESKWYMYVSMSWEVDDAGAVPESSLATEILADSPTAYWKLDETSGNFQDSGPGGFHMTAVGTVQRARSYLAPKLTGKYLALNTGVNGAIINGSKLGTSPPLTGDWTIEGIVVNRSPSTLFMLSMGAAQISGLERELSVSSRSHELNTDGHVGARFRKHFRNQCGARSVSAGCSAASRLCEGRHRKHGYVLCEWHRNLRRAVHGRERTHRRDGHAEGCYRRERRRQPKRCAGVGTCRLL